MANARQFNDLGGIDGAATNFDRIDPLPQTDLQPSLFDSENDVESQKLVNELQSTEKEKAGTKNQKFGS